MREEGFLYLVEEEGVPLRGRGVWWLIFFSFLSSNKFLDSSVFSPVPVPIRGSCSGRSQGWEKKDRVGVGVFFL